MNDKSTTTKPPAKAQKPAQNLAFGLFGRKVANEANAGAKPFGAGGLTDQAA